MVYNDAPPELKYPSKYGHTKGAFMCDNAYTTYTADAFIQSDLFRLYILFNQYVFDQYCHFSISKLQHKGDALISCGLVEKCQ